MLLFLHADVGLPSDAARHVASALADPEVIAGAFRTWTVADRPTALGPLLHLADLRSRYTSLPYGDQALFVRARGFADVTVRGAGRRFVARPVYYTALVNAIPLLYRAGVPATALARLYGAVR